MNIKVTLAGATATIDTGIKYSTLERVAEVKPESLSLKDEDGNELYKVTVSEGSNSISKFGAAIGQVGNNRNAVITINLSDVKVADRTKTIVKDYTGAINTLETVLEQATSAGKAVEEAEAKIEESIEFVDEE